MKALKANSPSFGEPAPRARSEISYHELGGIGPARDRPGGSRGASAARLARAGAPRRRLASRAARRGRSAGTVLVAGPAGDRSGAGDGGQTP